MRPWRKQRLAHGAPAVLKLIYAPDGYWCEIQSKGKALAFLGADASEAYAEALLHILEENR